MIANSKRFKSVINLVRKDIEGRIKDTRGKYGGRDLTKIERGFNTRFNNQLYGWDYTIIVCLDGTKLKVVEDAGIVYVGVDLDQSPSVYLSGSDTKDFESFIWDQFSYNLYSPSPELKADVESTGFSVEYIKAHSSMFYSTEAYKKIKRVVDDVTQNYTCSYKLKEGEWPRLHDRSVLPVATLDFTKNQITFNNHSRINGYRKNVDTFPIDVYPQHMDTALRNAKIPIYLHQGKFTSKYTGTVTF